MRRMMYMLDDGFLIDVLKDMLRIRVFEQKVDELLMTGEIGGTAHLCIGQEACAVAVGRLLEKNDVMFGHHRAHGHFLMKGGEPGPFMAELFAKKDGYCKGKGGSIHLANVKDNYMGNSGIVGAVFPIAVGAAFSLSYMDEKERIVAAVFGDGSTSEGSFHEAMNLAAIWELPILLICENNQYALSMPWKESSLLDDVADRVLAYGIERSVADGNNFFEAYDAVKNAVEYVRRERKPYFIELKTYRQKGHSKSDPIRTYRSLEEEKYWKQFCPVKQLSELLTEKGAITEEDIERFEADAEAWVEQGVEFARGCGELPVEAAAEDIFFGEEAGI